MEELEDELYLELKDIPVDTRGHRQIYNPSRSGSLDGTHIDANISRIRTEDPLTNGFASIMGGAYSCAHCDTYPGFTVVAHPDGPRGVGLRAKTPCAMPDGIETVVRFVVKSGRIIVSHDLRPVFDVDLPNSPGYNSAAGQAVFAQQMAAVGVATGITHNGGRELVRLDDDLYGIVSQDDEYPEHHDDNSGHVSSLGYVNAEALAEVDGAVCAYAIADYDNWAATARARGLDPDAILAEPYNQAVVIDFPKGVYLFVNHAGYKDFENNGAWPLIWTTITKVAPYMPQFDE